MRSRHASTRSSKERIQFPHSISSLYHRKLPNQKGAVLLRLHPSHASTQKAEETGRLCAAGAAGPRREIRQIWAAREITGEHMQCHLGGYLRQALHPRASTSPAYQSIATVSQAGAHNGLTRALAMPSE